MRIAILSIIFLSFYIQVYGQNWMTLNHIGSVRQDAINSMCIDVSGNYYLSLNYSGANSEPCFVDGQPINNIPVSTTYLLIKFGNTGIMQWSKVVWSSPFSSIAYDSSSNSIIMAGRLDNYATLCDSVNFLGGNSDIIVSKLDTSGNCIWTRNFGGTSDEEAWAITSDMEGNIYIAGRNDDTANFDSYSILPGQFIAKLDSSGTVLWAKNKFSFSALSSIWRMKCYRNDLFIYGNCHGDTLVTDTITLVNSPKPSGIIARLDSMGNYKWIKLIDRGAFASNHAMDMDDYGNIYMASSIGTFGGIFDNDTIPPSPNSLQIVLCKLDIDGNVIWLKTTSSSSNTNTRVNSLTVDIYQSIYITGHLEGSSTFENLTFLTQNLADMYVVRYDSSGNVIGGVTSNSFTGFGRHVTCDSDGNLFVFGDFIQDIEIAPLSSLSSIGSYDIYIAKCSPITGVESYERHSNNELLIYANPMQGKCNILVPDELLNSKKLFLSIYNSLGKVIQHKEIQLNEEKIMLKLDQEAKGIYSVSLSNGQSVYSGKIIFE